MILIGVHGRRRSGKTNIARRLVDQHGFAEVAFAAPIYRGLAAMLGVDLQDLMADDLKEIPIAWLGRAPRHLTDTLGFDWGVKMVCNDLWIRIAQREIEKHRAAGAPGVVLSDVRREAEVEYLLAQGGELWIVTRPNQPASPFEAHPIHAGLASTYPARGIVNGAGFMQLHERVDQLIEERIAKEAGQ